MQIWYAFAAACAVMLISFSGVIFSSGRLGTWMQRYLTYLATFSGGVFLLIAYHLAEEAVHEGGWAVGVVSIIFGAALMEGIHYFFPLEHHHHEHEESHAHTRVDGRKVLAADALHNVGDGILLVGAFASDIYVGIAATVGVLLHEMVQEISEYFVLRESGLTNAQALIRNFAVSSSILIGFIFAAFISWGPLVAILSGLAAGGFLSVVLHDLIPHAYHSVRTHGGGAMHIIAALLGATAMFALQTALPHEEHADEHMEGHAEEIQSVDQPETQAIIAPIPAPAAANTSKEPAVTTPTTTRPSSGAEAAEPMQATFVPPARTPGTPN